MEKRTPPEGLFVQNATRDGNKIIYSRLKNFEQNEVRSSHLSIKYVLDGTEGYAINNNRYEVKQGEYLLINCGQSYEGSFNSTKPVSGMCFSLNQGLLSEVHENLNRSDEYLLECASVGNAVPSFEFHEAIYSDAEDELGPYLKELCAMITIRKCLPEDEKEIYYSLTSHLLKSQKRTLSAITRIKAGKHSTRTELFRRVQVGKSIIDACFQMNISVESIAEQAAMSQYHFFRIFRQAFGVSPYQYLIGKRLEASLTQLKQGKLSISEIAYLNGFNDIYSFSKSFKKAHKASPSAFLKKPDAVYV